MTSPTLLLVHGAWSGAWIWSRVGRELDQRATPWCTVDLPSSIEGAHPETYLLDDARAVADVARDLGPVVLVGHSYGGAVITEAAGLIEECAGLLYVAALIPELGQSATECARRVAERTVLDRAIYLDGPYLRLEPELAGNALYQDCEREDVDEALSRLSSQTLASFRSPRTSGDVARPRWYVKCRDDFAVSPTLQDLLARHCDEVVTLASGHSPMWSRPHTLADLLVNAFASG